MSGIQQTDQPSATEDFQPFSARDIVDKFIPYASIVVALIAWEIAAQLKVVMPFLLPAFSTVLVRIGEHIISGDLFVDAALTLYRALAGFALAAVSGVAIGILMSRIPLVHWFFDPIVSISLPLPKIALLPIFMLWFGLFDGSKIMMVWYNSVFIVIIATLAGTQSVDQQLVWSARSLGASRSRVLWEIIVPASLPQILTGLQVALPICLIVALIAEFVMGGRGIGDSMLAAARYANSPGVFAGILEIGLLGFGVIKSMEWIRRRMLSWHQESNSG